MTKRSSVSIPAVPANESLAWSPYPNVMTTLLAAIVVTTLFIGLSALTSTAWFVWVGLVIMAALVGLHLWRYWQAGRKRAIAREQLNATLIGQCRALEESTFLKRHPIGGDPMVLALTEDSLNLGFREPLDIFATIPTYNIQAVTIDGSTPRPTLMLEIRSNGERLYTLSCTDFEAHAPAQAWQAALTQTRQ